MNPIVYIGGCLWGLLFLGIAVFWAKNRGGGHVLLYVTVWFRDGGKQAFDGVIDLDVRGDNIKLTLSDGNIVPLTNVSGHRSVISRNQEGAPKRHGLSYGDTVSTTEQINKDTPVVRDEYFHCQFNCRRDTLHQVIYDPRTRRIYRTCYTCHTESEWTWEGHSELIESRRHWTGREGVDEQRTRKLGRPTGTKDKYKRKGKGK